MHLIRSSILAHGYPRQNRKVFVFFYPTVFLLLQLLSSFVSTYIQDLISGAWLDQAVSKLFCIFSTLSNSSTPSDIYFHQCIDSRFYKWRRVRLKRNKNFAHILSPSAILLHQLISTCICASIQDFISDASLAQAIQKGVCIFGTLR